MNFASVRQANRKGMAPIRRLAGHHCHRIHESRLRRTYRAHSLSDFPFSIPYEQRKFCDLARILAKNRAFRWVLHSKCPFFSLLARHFTPAKPAWCLQWATVALLSASLVAMLDEWHQS